MKKAKDFNQPLYMCFVDFHKAYSMINSSYDMFDMHGFPPHLIDLLWKLCQGQKANVRFTGIFSRVVCGTERCATGVHRVPCVNQPVCRDDFA